MILIRLEETLQTFAIEIDDILCCAEKSVNICVSSIDDLRSKISKYKFETKAQEIKFFKEVKPQFVSRLIYFITIYNIETHRPNGSVKIKRKYLQFELTKLKNFFDENLGFYRYYRTGSTYLDNKYFARGKHDIRLKLDSFVYEYDPKFCTSHDFKVSTILANDLLQVYLENELNKLDYQVPGKDNQYASKSMLQWTSSKVALTELLYALHSSGVFNNGNTDIKTIAANLEKMFDVELGDYYRAYLELKLRHNPTKFIDSLRDNFIRKIEEDDMK